MPNEPAETAVSTASEGPVLEKQPLDATKDSNAEILSEINTKLDLLLSAQGVDYTEAIKQ